MLVFFVLIASTFSLLQGSEDSPGNIKFRVGNTFPTGVVVMRVAPPRQVLSSVYLPAQRTDVYPASSIDMYFLQFDIVGVWMTNLDENATEEMIDRAQIEALRALAEGKVSLWKIASVRKGLTKVFLNVVKLSDTSYALAPNGTVQEGSEPEIMLQPLSIS